MEKTMAPDQGIHPREGAPSPAGDWRPFGWTQDGGWMSRGGPRLGDTARACLFSRVVAWEGWMAAFFATVRVPGPEAAVQDTVKRKANEEL